MSYCLCDNDDPVSIPLCQIHGHQPSFNHTCLEGIDLISEAHLDLYRCFCFSALRTDGERGNYIQVHFAAEVIQVHTAHTDTCGYAFALMLLLLFSFKVKYRPFLPSVTMPKQDYLLVEDHPNYSTMTTIHYKSHHKTHFQRHHLSFLENHSNQTPAILPQQ